MAEIVAIADFKARKLAHAEAEWLRLMDLIDKLQADGKFEAAKPLLEKTKAIRVTIDKLRAPPPKKEHRGNLFMRSTDGGYHDIGPVTFTFSADMGYPKTTPPAP